MAWPLRHIILDTNSHSDLSRSQWQQKNGLLRRRAWNHHPNLELTRCVSPRVARFARGWNLLSNFLRHVNTQFIHSLQLITSTRVHRRTRRKRWYYTPSPQRRKERLRNTGNQRPVRAMARMHLSRGKETMRRRADFRRLRPPFHDLSPSWRS